MKFFKTKEFFIQVIIAPFINPGDPPGDWDLESCPGLMIDDGVRSGGGDDSISQSDPAVSNQAQIHMKAAIMAVFNITGLTLCE